MLRYFDDIEVFCPGDTCNGFQFPSLPYGVTGAVSGYVNGTAFICGGARYHFHQSRPKKLYRSQLYIVKYY